VSEAPADAHPRDRLRRALTLQDATLLVVASVIGSGIFLTPGAIAELLPDGRWILAAWVAGGLLSGAGALANAELGGMFPRAGGDYVFLREAFHPAAGFLVGWLSFFAIFAGTCAALAAGFGAGLASLLGWSPGAALPVALGVTLAVSALNWIGVKWGARANNVTSYLKLAALAALVLLGPLAGREGGGHLAASFAGAGPVTAAGFALALSPILFSYLGWNATVYVGSEIQDAQRNLPRSLFLGLGICTTVYLLVNGVYLHALPLAELRGVPNAGEAAASALFGAAGGSLVGVFVLASILGTLFATALVGPRIAYAMSLDGLFPGADRVHARFATPTAAIGIQAATIVVLLLVLRTFPSALDFTVFAILLATMADVAALYRLRRLRPEQPRPYRAWGYPLLPAAYLAANALIAGVMLAERPGECAVGLALLAAGLPFYAWLRGRGPGPEHPQ
jgi:APA family basic amino acid/polyamine antiporter